MKYVGTVIVGAGISGIACAKSMIEQGQDFTIISPNIGGRIHPSKNGDVQYGAYYVSNNYNYFNNLVNIGRRINPFKTLFHKDSESYTLLSKRLFSSFNQLLKLILFLKEFKKEYEKFKLECLERPQSECLRNNKYLFNLYNQSASEFIKNNRLEKISLQFLTGLIYGSTFTSIEKINSFTLLHLCLPIITPVYEFYIDLDKIQNLLSPYFLFDTVTKIEKIENGYRLSTLNNNIYITKKVFIATPPEVTKKLLNLNIKLNDSISAFMYHIGGEIKESYIKGQINLFDYNNQVIAIARQKDGTYLFYSKQQDIDFKEYFNRYEIIENIHWNPAFNNGGSEILDFKYDENLYIIGDNNICCLEDCYIYGMYAAKAMVTKWN